MVAIDDKGHIACANSINGAVFKGKNGDPLVQGNGAYCETGTGGAIAVGNLRFMLTMPAYIAFD